MNHQVQGLVLVNGEWVSRPLDVYQIMAGAQQDDTEMREPAVKTAGHPHAPGYGILSKTVLPSPSFKFILPANIRHTDLNDIVLVGEDSVQLKEIQDYGRLRNAAVKSDFSGRILEAGVFGDPREVHVHRSVGSPLPKTQTSQKSRRFTASSEGDSLPPEVVVLTLTSRTLMFLWAQQTATGKSGFRQRTVKLPAGSSRFDRLGQYLAIDTKRRAMAVAAYEGRFMLYKTKSMQTWRKELQNGDDTIPIEDERIMSIEGRIMHMGFLSSAAGQDDYHVVLLFIVVHQGLTKITCFDWDCRYDLSTATARTERVSVDLGAYTKPDFPKRNNLTISDDQSPSLLIPLRRSPDFLLVFDTHISIYKDVLSGAPQRTAVPIPAHILTPLHPGDSTRWPQWVQWDKTPRNPDFPKETFYIAREDGRVMYAEQGPAGALDMDDAGEWPYRIDKAFACLTVDNSEFSQSYPDVLMAGAAENDGLLCKVGAWPMEYSYTTQYPAMNQFTYVESMPNWSPLTGLCVTNFPGIRDPYERERSAMLVSNGVAPHGQVSELRYGVHALIDGSFAGMNGCTGLWVVHHGSQTVELDGKSARQHYALLLATLPLETILLRLVRTQSEACGQFAGAWEDGVWDVTQLPTEDEPVDDGVTRAEETIAACTVFNRFSIQITRKSAQTLTTPTLASCDRIDFAIPILLAASTAAFPFIATVFKAGGKNFVEITPILNDGTFEKHKRAHSRHILSTDPTCIEILDIDGQPHILVGTLDSRITVFQVSPENGLSSVFSASLDTSSAERSRTLCESAVTLTSESSQVLVCATRDGLLLSRCISDLPTPPRDYPEMGTGTNTVDVDWTISRMGSTSTQIHASSTDDAVAFVSCGPDFCRVRCTTNTPLVLDVESIWFANRTNPGYLQKPVTAIYQLSCVGVSGIVPERNLGGFLFAVSGDQMLYTQLDTDVKGGGRNVDLHLENECKTLPRKLITGARPTFAAYLNLPRKMLVATIETKTEREQPNGYRAIHSALALMDVHDNKALDETEVKQEAGTELMSRLLVAQHALNHAERVYSIADWPFEDDRGRKYNLVIVGTGIGAGSGKETGRRLIFNLGQRGSRLSLQKESAYDSPVYCVAMFDRRATVSVIGKKLSFDEFDAGLGR